MPGIGTPIPGAAPISTFIQQKISTMPTAQLTDYQFQDSTELLHRLEYEFLSTKFGITFVGK